MNMIEKVARAIAECGNYRPYGLYDYSSYDGDSPPHQVKNEKTREVLLKSWNREAAESEWIRLNQAYVAKAAIAAMREPSEGMLKAFYGDVPVDQWLGDDWRDMIDAALKEE